MTSTTAVTHRGWFGPMTERRIALALLVLHLVITLPLAAVLNVATDESFSLLTTSQSFGHALHRGLWFELQPPLYFGLLNLWRQAFGDSIFAARLLSVLCGALVVLLAGGLSRRYLPRVHSPRIVALLALHPFVIWAAVEIRLYALMLLVSMLQLITFHDGFLTGPDRTSREDELNRCRSRVWYLVLAVIGLYTHYYSGFLLVVNAAVLLVHRRWRSLGIYLLCMTMAGFCFAPMLLVVPEQVGEHTIGAAATDARGAVQAVLWQAEHYLLPVSVRPDASELERSRIVWPLLILSAPLLLLAGSLRSCWKQGTIRPTGFHELLFWNQSVTALLIAGLLLLAFVAVVHVTGPELFEFRHGVALFIPLTLAACAIVAAIGGNRAIGWWTCLVLCFSIPVLGQNYATLSKGGDWKRVARWIESSEKPGEPVVVFIPWAALPLSHHYDGRNELVVIPRPEEGLTYRMSEYVLDSPEQIDERIEPALKNGDGLWLVTSGPKKYVGVEFGFDVLDEWLTKRFTVEEDVTFNGSRVRYLKRRGGTTVKTVAGHEPVTPKAVAIERKGDS